MSVSGTCPEWCTTNHLGIDEPVEHDGPQWPDILDATGAGRAEIGICTNGAHGVVVALYAESTLTPKQAREVANALLGATAWAEDHATTDLTHGEDPPT
jgi:hypothetical protein